MPAPTDLKLEDAIIRKLESLDPNKKEINIQKSLKNINLTPYNILSSAIEQILDEETEDKKLNLAQTRALQILKDARNYLIMMTLWNQVTKLFKK